MTELEDDTIFNIRPLQPRSYEKDYNAQVDITFEVNPHQLVIARDMYTFLDLLSDIGGMQGMLVSGFGFLIAIWNFNYFDDFMASRLYKLKKPETERKVLRGRS